MILAACNARESRGLYQQERTLFEASLDNLLRKASQLGAQQSTGVRAARSPLTCYLFIGEGVKISVEEEG